MNILRQIRWAYQRVIRGYDDRVFWGFDKYFVNIIDPLEKFCNDELCDSESMALNPQRETVYNKTAFLIQEYRKHCDKDFYNMPNTLSILMEYVGKNINMYWD